MKGFWLPLSFWTVPSRVDMGQPDQHPPSYAVKQQTLYLFGKENIHQAIVKKIKIN